MRYLLFLLFHFFLISELTMASSPVPENPLLYYVYRAPKIASDKPPLLLLLHGVGSNERDLFSFAEQLPPQYLVVSARGPYDLGQDGYGWYELSFVNGKAVFDNKQAERSRLLILDFIEQLKTKHAFDDQQVYLCGFSQGGILSYSVALTNPSKIKGIAVMSGRLLEEVKPLIAPKQELRSLSVFISHGTKDHVLAIQNAHNALAYLKQLGIAPVYKEYPEGHAISREMLADLLQWLK